MGMIARDPLDDKLADGHTVKVCYHVEVNFNDCRGWLRNFQEHETLLSAEQMARHFRKSADVRIVKVETAETVVA